MKLNNIKVYSINIYPYGGIIKSDMLINTNSKKVLLISLGGIFIQLILYIIFFILSKINFISIKIYSLFLKYNTFIILFNLLPINPLDGYKILNSIFELFISFKKSIFISIIINILVLILFLIYLYIYKINNIIIITFLIFSLITYIKSYKYIINKFYIERIIYDLKLNGIVSINNINNIYKNKLNYINGINEKNLINSIYKL